MATHTFLEKKQDTITLEGDRLRALKQLSSRLSTYVPRSGHLGWDDSFASIINECQTLLEASDTEFADMVGASRPTVGRWKSGKTSPHPLGRESAISRLVKIVDKRAHVIEKSIREKPSA